MSVALSPRDRDVLKFIAANKAASLDVLAQRFFRENPKSGKANRDPLHACRRRVQALVDAGLIDRIVGRGPLTTVRVTPRAADSIGVARPRALPMRGRSHHVATLRAIEILRARLEREGVRVVEAKLEFQLRSEEQRGRATRAGEDYAPFPDALLVLERTAVDGSLVREEAALEYVTSKYTDADIREKHASFERYARALWVADRPSTSARVARLIGAEAMCL